MWERVELHENTVAHSVDDTAQVFQRAKDLRGAIQGLAKVTSKVVHLKDDGCNQASKTVTKHEWRHFMTKLIGIMGQHTTPDSFLSEHYQAHKSGTMQLQKAEPATSLRKL